MDGHLDPERQQRVESALAASPQLAETMRGLVLVRDMVAGLPRDGSVDVRARVMQQIRARQQRGFLPTLEGWRHGSRRILPLAGLAVTAASLMVAASLAILMQTSQLDRGQPPVGELARIEAVAPTDPVVLPVPVPVDAKATSSAPVALASSSHSDIAARTQKAFVRPLLSRAILLKHRSLTRPNWRQTVVSKSSGHSWTIRA